MKKTLLFLFLLTLGYNVDAQVKYEEGYIIDNSGNRTQVWILNKGWRDNPAEITYKRSADGEVQTAGVNEIKEFGIGDYAHYRRYLTAIDQSRNQVDKLSTTAEPEYRNSTVFLKTLVEGKVSLYSYREGINVRFFYTNEDGKPEPLVYKKYREGLNVAVNNNYRQQLYSNLNCRSLSGDFYRKMEYTEDDLVEYFEAYNACMNNDYRVIADQRQRGEFNFYVKGGMQFSSISVERGMSAKGAELSFKPGVLFGAEAEYVLAFNRNKWAIFIEPTYQAYALERAVVNTTSFEFLDAHLTLDFKFISTAGGVRHYMFLNENSKLFLNAGVVYDIPLKSRVYLDLGNKYQLQPELDKVETEIYLTGGFGYNYSNRLSAEIRYYPSKVLLGEKEVPENYYFDWEAKVSTLAIILGYSF